MPVQPSAMLNFLSTKVTEAPQTAGAVHQDQPFLTSLSGKIPALT